MRGLALLLAVAAMATAQQAPAPGREDQALRQLLSVRRVFVDRFNGGETAAHLRDMIIASLESTKLFVITENAERADTFLRGSAEDLVFTDTFQSNDSIDARVQVGRGSSYSSGSSRQASRNLGASVGEQESTRIAERKHEATASVRLVTKDGDVIWSAIEESMGGKFRGASADVADKIARKLTAAYERARKAEQSPALVK
ncbi:MAG: hypothetical protein LLG20_01180 [Acidobacteriales bacterium]|nr:hypothetical protein [Terriglobales bacterium]